MAEAGGSPVRALRRGVINSGLCAVCGTCAAVCPDGSWDFSKGEPEYRGGCSGCGRCLDACPGADLPMAELEQFYFGRERSEGDELGFYRSLHTGYALDDELRAAGTAGGWVTALLCGLLESGRITGAVVTGFSQEEPWRPEAFIARTPEGIRSAAQSKYALTPQNLALLDARHEDRLAVVALPCQVAGIRKAQATGAQLPKIELLLGLYCLSNFLIDATVYLIEGVFGVSMEEVSRVAYREGEFPGNFRVVTREGVQRDLAYPEAKQHLRMYRPYRCTVCYYWSAELADISVGDLWSDPSREAYSSIVVRSAIGEETAGWAGAEGLVYLESLEAALVTDNPGFRYKKRGNAVTIREARRHRLPTPTYPDNSTLPTRGRYNEEEVRPNA